MPNSRIMIIRHAEKPEAGGPPYGINEDGDLSKDSLTVKGWQRAGALACLFGRVTAPLRHPSLATPDVIFASGIAEHSKSLRPQQTVAPLARVLRLEVNSRFVEEQEAELAAAAIEQKGNVLISWQHEKIPEIANQIMGNTTATPQNWPKDRYDLVWVFTRENNAGPFSFQQVPELLLDGDSPSVL
jgi:broad specificity phosphatase PhoE